MSSPNQPEIPDSVVYAPRRMAHARVSWAASLIFACLVLGVMASIVQWERQRLGDARAHIENLQSSLSAVDSQREDIGELLADPRTRLIRLIGSDNSPVRTASLAWNPARLSGALFCDKLPVLDSGQQYEIWFVNDAAGSRLASINVRPGVSIYPFHSDSVPQDSARVEITAGPRSVSARPWLAGDVQ